MEWDHRALVVYWRDDARGKKQGDWVSDIVEDDDDAGGVLKGWGASPVRTSPDEIASRPGALQLVGWSDILGWISDEGHELVAVTTIAWGSIGGGMGSEEAKMFRLFVKRPAE